ncbi:MAG: MBL fold metallo-hydrolase [Verrucomicrobiota bacterium]
MKDTHSSVSRRQFGLAAIATPLIAALSPRSVTAEPGASSVPASIYRASLGNYHITSLLDGIVPLGRDLFSGPSDQIDPALQAAGLTGETLPAPISAFLLTSEEKTILVDAGTGSLDMLGPGLGQISAGLDLAGVTPDQIDTLVVTHAHPDHIGGLLDAQGQPAFANAEIIIAEPEMAFWSDPAALAQAPEGAKGLFQLAQTSLAAYGDRVAKATAGTEIAPGLTLELSPGHTPGHSLLHVDGGDTELLIIADTLHSADLHTAVPDVGFGFDVDPKLAAQSRAKLFDRISTDKVLIAGSHIHFPGFGRILKNGAAYRFAPATW